VAKADAEQLCTVLELVVEAADNHQAALDVYLEALTVNEATVPNPEALRELRTRSVAAYERSHEALRRALNLARRTVAA
jgi:hypothetical protein